MQPQAAILPCGTRLHLQHGPIDLVIGADGERQRAFAAARARFETLLEELAAELPLLRTPLQDSAEMPSGETARRMDRAARPHDGMFVTRMAAVAGAVADTVLAAMQASARLKRAYVNNGGDIALALQPGQSFTSAISDHRNQPLGTITVAHGDGIGGIATSGRHGRSLSLGIADSVTVLAGSAAAADAAATLIANAVDLPGHPAITRQPACELQPDSDLGRRAAVTGCRRLPLGDIHNALQAGLETAQEMQQRGLIRGAALFLHGEARLAGPTGFTPTHRTLMHA